MFNELQKEEALNINGGNPIVVIIAVGGLLCAATEIHNVVEGVVDGMKGVHNHNGKFGN